MNLALLDGQVVAGFTLLHALPAAHHWPTWLAQDPASGARVCLKFLPRPLTPQERQTITAAILRYRGLVHPNISRTLSLEHYPDHQGQGTDFLVCQSVAASQPLAILGSPRVAWPWLAQLLAALAYSHNLDAAHGHIAPASLALDGQRQLILADFGLPLPLDLYETSTKAFFSPQILAGQPADTSDDIYAIGALLYQLLTGESWQQGAAFAPLAPVPDDIRQLLQSMLATSAFDRPRRIATVLELLSRHYGQENSGQENSGPEYSGPASSVASPSGPALQNTAGNTSQNHAAAEGSFTGTINVQAFSRRDAAHPAAPPGAASVLDQQPLTEGQAGIPATTVIIALLSLLLVAAGIFWLLPTTVAPSSQAQPPVAQVTPPAITAGDAGDSAVNSLAPLEIARLERLKEQAKQVANDLLRLQIELEDQGVQVWAQAPYQQLLDQGLAADERYRQGQYSKALAAYQAASQDTQALLDSIGTVIAANQQLGEAALAAGDAQAAIQAFTQLLAIRPANATYQASLARARNLSEVIDKVRAAEAAQANNNLAGARDLYQQALALDNQWPAARQGLARVKEQITREQFNAAMSLGFRSLDQGQLDAARQAFVKAQGLLPDAVAPADGLLQISLRQQAQAIAELQTGAEQATKAEDWPLAIQHYDKLLALDPTLVFATTGLTQARQRLELDETLNTYLQAPQLMRDDPALEQAKASVIAASRTTSKGPRLQRQINDLSQLVALARIPLQLVLTSDGMTDVTVYKVGNFGKLARQELSLVPGIYTIVGKRPGYRDIKQQLTLAGGANPTAVHISCVEKI
ncbi:MAG: hypothetical protein NWR09_06530 [Pseudomonadales bacterium]|nr:hypothetical protein [Pseudomonadales bacterium]